MAFPPQPPGSGFGAPPFGPPPPGWPSQSPSGEPPPNHTGSLIAAFGLSAASFFCCSLFAILPLVFAIIAAVQASGGNHEGARTMSKTAIIIGGIMVGLGALVWIAYIVLMVVGSASGGY